MDLHDQPDERVIPLALTGDRDAWNVLIVRHQRRVLLTLLSRGVRIDHARDIVQDTWTRLIAQQHAGRLERLELPGLAIKQAAWLASDDTRRRRRESGGEAASGADDPALLRVADPAPSVEARLCTRVQLDRAIAELERCSPTARRVFEIVYDDPSLPHAIAAERVGLSVQRVRQTVCEVRARLRAALERSDDPS